MVEVQVVRHGNFYFHNIFRNGERVIFGESITADRARQIVESSTAEGAETTARGELSFVAGDQVEFSFTARWNRELVCE